MGTVGRQETIKQTCAHCVNSVEGYCTLTAEREKRSDKECVKLGQCVDCVCTEVRTYLHLCSD